MKSILTAVGVLAISSLSILQADDSFKASPAPRAASEEKQASRNLKVDDRDWSIEVGTGYIFSDVRTDLPGYSIIPATLTASVLVDDVSLDNWCLGIFRGYTEFFFRGFGYTVLHGTESQFVGAGFGPRYNFVQPGWPVVPFIEGNVGFAFTDSRGAFDSRGQIGQGQDFCFNFGIASGLRYDINDTWFLRGTLMYTHFSNAGLSEPGRKNRAFDGAGPELAIGCRF